MPITWTNGGSPPINAANLNALPQVDKANVFTAPQRFNGGLGVNATPDAKQPINFTSVLNGQTVRASGSLLDKVACQFNTIVTGDFTGDVDVDSSFLWGQNVFLLTGSAVGDGKGLGTITSSLVEANINTPAGTTFETVTGQEVSASYWGTTAGAHVNTMSSLLVRAPKRQNGATGGSVDNAYTLFVEGFDGTGVGATAALSLYVSSGVTRLGGRLDVQNTIAATGGGMTLQGSLTSAAASMVLNDVAAGGGHAQVKLGGSGSVFAVTNSGGTNVFMLDSSGGLTLTLASTTTAPTAGAAGALPATPAGYATVTINGTAQKVAYY